MLKHPLKGSECKAVARGKPAGPAERLEVTILLRRNALQDRTAHIAGGDDCVVPLKRTAPARQHGASAANISAIRQFAAAHNLSVIAADARRHSVVLSGTAAGFSAAFGETLAVYDHPNGTYRGRDYGINLPAELQDIVEAVLGLDKRAQASMAR
jgi:kumamolisin